MSPSVVRNNESPRKKFSKTEPDGTLLDLDNENISKDHTDNTDNSTHTGRPGRPRKNKSHKKPDADTTQSPKMFKLQKSNERSPIAADKTNGAIKKESPTTKQEPISDSQHPSIDETLANDKTLLEKKNTIDCRFSVGQLAWAQVSSYPFWPCVVTIDGTIKSHLKQRAFGKSTLATFVHVQYFGDSCRHGWVYEMSMLPFTGIADFLKLAEDAKYQVKKRHRNIISLYTAKKTMKRKWDTAIEEATEVLPMTNEERAELFMPREEVKSKYEELLELATRGRGYKRERWSDSNNPNPKRVKQEDVSDKGETETSKKKSHKGQSEDDEKSSTNLNAETPPTPPSSHKDSSDECTIIKKDKVKKRKKDLDGDFEFYYERNRDMIEDAQPDATEDEIRTYLEKTWANMSLTLRSKYRSRIKPANGEPTKEDSIDQEDVSSIESDSRYNANSKSAKKKKSTDAVQAKEPSTDQEDESSVESDSRYNKKSKSTRKKKSKNSVRTKESSTDQEEESSVDLEPKYHKKPKSNESEKEESRVNETVKRRRPYNLFRGTKQERVCQICEKTGDLTRCKGPCYSYFHLSCVKPGESSSECSMDEDTMENGLFSDLKETKKSLIGEEDAKSDEVLEDETFKCIDCLSGVAPACFICNEREDDRLRCSVAACGKHYHRVCLKTWPQAHWRGGGRLTCPYHMCHTCNSDNPQNGISWSLNEKLVRCVRCPSAYHPATSCLPAGTEILTGSQIVCPKHYIAPGPPINATWCFLCTTGGSLICCDTCPTSFHPECLGIDAPDGAFICEDCETGRMPLYGEVVWVKLGLYRWWPSRVCFPHEIPSNLEAIQHHPGEFCVMFLGTNNYYWVHRGRAFLYQDGDASAKVSKAKKNVDDAYQKALEEANEIHERLKTERAAAKGTELRFLRPPPYVKLKINKPVGNVKPAEVESIGACDCDPKWDHPCAPDSDCLNRILSVECSPAICPAGPKCNNQAFVRREYPAMEPFHTVGRGWGLRTLEPIKEGKFVVEYVGEVIDEAEYKRRLHHKKELKNENFYFLTIDQSRMIDAEPKGNLSRFMNHSCMPNCETQKWTVNGDTRIGLFALRDIEVGEELTFNYNLACDGETRKPCLCGAPNCSGFIGLKAQKQKVEEEKKTSKSDGGNEKLNKLDKSSKSEKLEKGSKSEKVDRSLKHEKIDKTPKSERVDRISRSDRTPKFEKIDRTPRSERLDKTPRSERIERTPRSERSEKTLRSEKGGRLARNERSPSKKSLMKIPECWSCGEILAKTDDYVECNRRTCFKRYHRSCVTLEKEDSQFNCPWHRCKECGRRTGAHCTFCSAAYCQGHLDGNLVENRDKIGYVCKIHEGMESRKSFIDEEGKEETDNEAETDKELSSLSSDSLICNEKSTLSRETSPRVAIVEVQFSSEEGEESQKEDDSFIFNENSNNSASPKKKRLRVAQMNKIERSSAKRNKRHKESIKTLRSLTPSQLESIIGGSLTIEPDDVHEQ
ncbi:histone-lysine N-methyltransferase NSD2 [Venturia canescens]|uniref:histone-lysine N-methyltransferase NSD2 n=1 Tax=Venturia canescens TaxID=32260 RepID=UPI001C9CC38B|nr:histone-lysine N-methyltransferase NSD2 [Venturia canescens]